MTTSGTPSQPGEMSSTSVTSASLWATLSATVSHYRLLCNSLVGLRFPSLVKRFQFGMPPLVLAVLLISGLADGQWLDALQKSMVAPSLAFVMLGLYTLVHGAIAMNTPAHALLVPHLRRRLIILVLGFWLLATPATLLFARPYDVGPWSALLYFGAMMISMCVSLVPKQRTMVLAVQTPLIIGALAYRQLPAWLLAFFNSDLGLAAATGLMLLFAWYAIGIMFPARGQPNANPVTLAQKITAETMMNFSGRYGARLYAFALRRACRGVPAPRRLLMHVFGPLGHWSITLPPAVIVLSGALVIKLLLLVFAGSDVVAKVAELAWIPAFLFGLFAIVGSARLLLAHLNITKAEQSLLRLAPGVAEDGRFNRQLAAGMLGRWCVEWSLNSLMLLGATWIVGGGQTALWIVGVICVTGLPSCVALLQDFARRKEVAALSVIAWTLAGNCLIVPLALLGVLGLGMPPMLAMIVAAPPVVAVLLLMRRGVMFAAPHAFPVERMA